MITDNYNMEIDKIINLIIKKNQYSVCLQLADGLKASSLDVVDKIKNKTNSLIYVWYGTNYGACDIPTAFTNLDIDLLVNFGHSKFFRVNKW